MKIISVTEHVLSEGTGSKTVIPLDQRPGIFFRVVCGTYETPFFTKEQTDIPVLMVHADRAQTNIKITCDGENLTIEQAYRQATFVYLFCVGNNDWTNTGELRAICLDATEIDRAVLSGGQTVDISAGVSGVQVVLTTSGYVPGSNTVYVQEIITRDNNQYICPFTMSSHQSSTEPIRYDYARTTVNRVLTVYEKAGVN